MSVTTIMPDESASDAFGRMRVSNPQTLFDSKLLFDKKPLFWDESVTDTSGNAVSTHVSGDALVTMFVEAEDTIVRQTKQRWNYQPGKSQQIVLTAVLTSGGTGVTGRIGQFDTNDGLFFQVSGTTVGVVKRKATVDTVVAQADWNLDKMDGTGPSSISVDFDKAQIFAIDYEWLSLGRIRFGFYLDGHLVYCHEIRHTNELTAAYMATPNNPIRYEIASAAGGDSATMKHICSTIISEGGQEAFGIINSVSTAGTALSAPTENTIYALAGIRLKAATLDASVRPISLSMMAETADDFEWMILLNPTVANTSDFTYADVTNSAVQTVTGTSDHTVTENSWDVMPAVGFTKNTQQSGEPVALDVNTPVGLGATIAGVRDEFVLAVRPLGASALVQGSLTWRELL